MRTHVHIYAVSASIIFIQHFRASTLFHSLLIHAFSLSHHLRSFLNGAAGSDSGESHTHTRTSCGISLDQMWSKHSLFLQIQALAPCLVESWALLKDVLSGFFLKETFSRSPKSLCSVAAKREGFRAKIRTDVKGFVKQY